MKLEELRQAIESHSGSFHCTLRSSDHTATKEVMFRHEYSLPVPLTTTLPIEKLVDFYETFSSLTLYHDAVSNDAAIYIAPPDEWESLYDGFCIWLDNLDEDEEDELLPAWIDDCLVFGEPPMSGNCFLMPLSGEKQGFVYEFEHDGFEFIECAPDIEQFIDQLLNLNSSALAEIASHMCFVENEDYSKQWWITEMRDNKGNVVRTSHET